MNLDHDFVQVSKLSEDQKINKKKVFTKNGTLFPLNSSEHLHSDAPQSQIIGGDADELNYWGIQSNYYPPRVSASVASSIPAGRQLFRIACV